MLVLEAKLKGKVKQFEALDEAIRTFRFIQNSCLRYWMDNTKVSRNDLYKYCKVSGWKLSDDRKAIAFTDKFGTGYLKLKGTRDLNFYQLDQINRVRVVRRCDGYYAQFLVSIERTEEREPTRRTIGLDVGLTHFYTDSNGTTVENPRYLRASEKRLKRVQRRASKKVKGSANRRKAVKRLGKVHLKVQRQRKDFAVKLARCVVKSNDFVALEELQIGNMLKNHTLAKSLFDAAWGEFRRWVEYFGKVYGVATVAVAPQYTSADCSNCGETVNKSLSTRTHVCPRCGHVQDRDQNAAINILKKGLNTVGHTGINAWGENDLCLNLETGLGKLTH